jgi:hypothetical protein
MDAVTSDPFARCLAADLEANRRLTWTHSLFNHLARQMLSYFQRQSGILMDVHPGSPGKLSLRKLGFSGFARMDNLLRFHS